MAYRDDTKTIIKRVTDYGRKPRTVRQALIQAHAFLAEEGQWTTGEFFKDGDPKEAYEKAQCSSWAACSMGALGLVTGEMPVGVERRSTYYSDDMYNFVVDDDFNIADTPLSARAALVLAEHLPGFEVDEDDADDEQYITDCAIEAVISFNDKRKGKAGRTRVLNAFEKAIRALGGEPLPEALEARKAAEQVKPKAKTKTKTKKAK